jgi:hypothetical protein
LSDVPNSLERSIAQQVFGDENLYTTIEDEVDRAKSLSYTQSKRDREIIQTISTLYNTPIHIYNTTNTLRDVITPLDSWGKEVKEPILLLQYEKGMYAALTKSKTIKVLLINKIVQQSRQEDTDIEDQIRNSFLQGKSWTAEDERQHQVLIQGPASFDNLQDLQWEIESQESLDMNDSRDSLSQKIQQKNYSPQLSRKSYNQEYQKALEMDNEYQDDSFEEQLAMAIQLSIQDQSRETGNVMGSYKNQSKDQPYKKK